MTTRRLFLLSATSLTLAPAWGLAQSGPVQVTYEFTWGTRRRRMRVTLRPLRRPGRFWARIDTGERVFFVRLRADAAVLARASDAVARSGGAITVGRTRAQVRLTGQGARLAMELRLGDGTTGTTATPMMDPVTAGVIVGLGTVGIVVAGIVAIVAIAGAQGTEVSASIESDGSSVSADVTVSPGSEGGEDTGD